MGSETYCDWCGEDITSDMKLFNVSGTDVCEDCVKGSHPVT